ncbi:hypothetical protein Vretimale_5458 [Volvox reticuliferus]|uniref:Uncharacterized protein n=1 Tax=Volvox reticuliferus TaxID=1737510 RepID=A0A8J4C815_9CHLO|nr:hypothetical protein Vretifemale_3748 [Volvox reticuliferus]GIM00313.1 hypothetical protein Vretimale_5458 [Volvox reticuliferus]
MACIAGRLRAARCAAIAAEAPSGSATYSLLQTTCADIYPAWFNLSWTATRTISTSNAHQDSAPSAGGGSRPLEGTSRARQRPGNRTEAPTPRPGVVHPQQRGSPRRDGAPEHRAGPSSLGSPRGSDPRQTSRADTGRPRWDRSSAAASTAGSRSPASGTTATSSSSASSSSRSPSLAITKLPSTQHQPQQQQQQQQQPGRWDLATQSAPQRVLQLIGDPRSGIADDTTINPFGEVTVDMVHYQPSNEVYWFKYEFASSQTRGSHRDARLSDYTRNLIYLMRAKDPKRWTIPALAEKFRIRKQRVLAILALKELEAQRIEDGRLLGGPLSAYALPVHLDDVHLDPFTGDPRLTPPMPLQQQQQQPTLDATEESSGAAATAAALQQPAPAARTLNDHVDVVLPRVVSAGKRLQLQLVELLAKYDFDPACIRTSLQLDLDRATEMAKGVFGATSAAYLEGKLQAYRAAIEDVVAAVEEVLAESSSLQEERRAAAIRRQVESTLAAAEPEVLKEASRAAVATAAAASGGGDPSNSGDGGTAAAAEADGAAGPSDGLLTVRKKLAEILDPVMKGTSHMDGDSAVQRVFFTFSPKTRGSLLHLLPDLSICLNAGGVDLARAAKDAAYRGPAAASAAAAAATAAESELSARQLEVDVFGFVPVSEHRTAALAAALQSLEAARGALMAKLEALDSGVRARQTAAPSAQDVQLARSLVRQYVAADVMWADLLSPSQAVVERRLALPSLDPARKRRMLEVLYEADPSALTRALQVEAAMQLRFRKAYTEADALAAGVGAAAAAANETNAEGEKQQQEEGEAQSSAARSRPGDRASWDALAAFLEAKVAGKVYGSGSGERHVARLPTYPAFEGYSLEEFDRVGEGEISALNRKVAERLDEEMYDRFRKDLLFNLGVRGERLRISPHEVGPYPSNLRTELERPVVVYGIGPDGTTQYPPLYVATGDGKKRPLNMQEKVFQERRAVQERLPYYMARIRRMPELE